MLNGGFLMGYRVFKERYFHFFVLFCRLLLEHPSQTIRSGPPPPTFRETGSGIIQDLGEIVEVQMYV